MTVHDSIVDERRSTNKPTPRREAGEPGERTARGSGQWGWGRRDIKPDRDSVRAAEGEDMIRLLPPQDGNTLDVQLSSGSHSYVRREFPVLKSVSSPSHMVRCPIRRIFFPILMCTNHCHSENKDSHHTATSWTKKMPQHSGR